MHKNNPPKPRQKRIPVEEPAQRPARKGRPKSLARNYGIEWYVSPGSIVVKYMKWKAGWHIHEWYEKEKDRDQALKDLLKKKKPWQNYRAIDRPSSNSKPGLSSTGA
jgi:hypothetical protein